MRYRLLVLTLATICLAGNSAVRAQTVRSPDGRLEATFRKVENYWMGSRSCRIDVRDRRTGKRVASIRHGIDSASYRLGEKLEGLIFVVHGYRPEYPCSPRLLDTLDGMAFSPDGTQLATCYDGRVRLFEIPSGARSGTLQLDQTGPMDASMEFSPDGAKLLVHQREGEREFTMDTRTGAVTWHRGR